MSSFSCNTRRANSPMRSRAFGAGIALMLLSGAALADGAHRFVFTAYSDAAGGRDIVAGRYRAAIEKLNRYPHIMDTRSSATNTNLCVAYAMTLQWRSAHAACDAAVSEAREQRDATPAWWGAIPASADAVAVAYANRAVMHWLLHDEAAARKDLARAQELSPRARFVARNLAALKMHTMLAQAGTPTPRS